MPLALVHADRAMTKGNPEVLRITTLQKNSPVVELKLEGEIAGIDKKLGNAAFTSRAPVHVVEEQRERRAETEAIRARIAAALDRLEKVAQP